MDTEARDQVRIIFAGPTEPSLFARKPVFSRMDVETYYSVSRTQATQRIRAWEARGWIEMIREGKQVQYRITAQ